MMIRICMLIGSVLLGFCVAVSGQTGDIEKAKDPELPEHVRSSPAFAEVILRRAVLEAELEELKVRYTPEFPKVVEMAFEISQLDTAIKKMTEVEEEESSRLSSAVGKLLVQRAVYATELNSLKSKYNDSHPEVKRTKRKLEIFEKAISRIF